MSPTERLDVWLWRARFFKTRSLAAAAIQSGAVRLVRQEASRTVDKPGMAVKVGDGICIVRGPRSRTALILALGARRGPAAEARTLYAECGPTLDDSGDAPHLTAVQQD